MIADIVSSIARLHRMDSYRIERPNDVIEDESGVQLWLLRHEGGGWQRANETERRVMARRLIFAVYLRGRGRLSDDKR